jgi:hypothetical protein
MSGGLIHPQISADYAERRYGVDVEGDTVKALLVVVT